MSVIVHILRDLMGISDGANTRYKSTLTDLFIKVSRSRILVQVTIYRRLLIGRNSHLALLSDF